MQWNHGFFHWYNHRLLLHAHFGTDPSQSIYRSVIFQFSSLVEWKVGVLQRAFLRIDCRPVVEVYWLLVYQLNYIYPDIKNVIQDQNYLIVFNEEMESIPSPEKDDFLSLLFQFLEALSVLDSGSAETVKAVNVLKNKQKLKAEITHHNFLRYDVIFMISLKEMVYEKITE